MINQEFVWVKNTTEIDPVDAEVRLKFREVAEQFVSITDPVTLVALVDSISRSVALGYNILVLPEKLALIGGFADMFKDGILLPEYYQYMILGNVQESE